VSWEELLCFGNRYDAEARQRRSAKPEQNAMENPAKSPQPLKSTQPPLSPTRGEGSGVRGQVSLSGLSVRSLYNSSGVSYQKGPASPNPPSSLARRTTPQHPRDRCQKSLKQGLRGLCGEGVGEACVWSGCPSPPPLPQQGRGEFGDVVAEGCRRQAEARSGLSACLIRTGGLP
jgi:hypothetical protein